MNYSHKIATAIHDFLENDGWKYRFDEEDGIFSASVKLTTSICIANIHVDVREDYYVVYLRVPLCGNTQDKDMMYRLSEFLHLANYGMIGGNFEFDPRDGEIRFKYYVHCEGMDVIPYEVIKESICFPPNVLNHYAPGMLAIIGGGMSAEKACNLCEGDEDGPELDSESDPDGDISEIVRSLFDSVSAQIEEDDPFE